MNKAWHEAHPLGPDASIDRRVEWHVEHARVCGCRPIPAAVEAVIRERSADPEKPD